ncbi:MAG: substrate-binding domain-containing protein [Oscillospiraceae bacterium]|jgi:ribose transport system substrate-binding protein
MTRRRTLLFVLLILLGLALALLLTYAAGQTPTQQEVRLSVILREETTDRWNVLSSGIQQACARLGIATPVTTMAGGGTQRQLTLIERDLAAGAQGFILAPASGDILEDLASVTGNTPAVLVEAHPGCPLASVGPDDALLAQTLAGGLLAEEEEVVVLAHNLHLENIRRRYDALLQQLDDMGIPVTVWESGGQDLTTFLSAQLRGKPPRAIVALDVTTLERAIDAATAIDALPRLYGIGSSDKIIYQLDRQLVREICYYNEFAVGYNAVMHLAEAIGLKTPEAVFEVEPFLVRQDNLYEPEVERLLFPSAL